VGAVVAVQTRRRMSILSERKRHVDSDTDDDHVPVPVLLSKPPKQKPAPEIPKGLDAIGLIVARDFGTDGGIYHGIISAVDMEGRRIHYHVTYDDGDEEDFDYDELKFAVELQQSIALGTYKAVQQNESEADDDEGNVHIPSEESDSDESDAIGTTAKKGVSKTETTATQTKIQRRITF
jgi:hypothetical protein